MQDFLQYSAWQIEQTAWAPALEPDLEKQLALSNGYISQYGYAEEHYSAPASAATHLRGLLDAIPSANTLSVRLHEERLDLAVWTVEQYYRCLHRQEPVLERRFTALSPSGARLEVASRRSLPADNPHLIEVEYTVRSLNYSGPISFLPLLGDVASQTNWYPMLFDVDNDCAVLSLQSRNENVRVVSSMSYELLKNGLPSTCSPIRIEKRYVVGYSITEHALPSDVFTLRLRRYVTDSRNYPLHDLLAEATAAVASPV